MDWIQYVFAGTAYIISAVIAYIATRHKSKMDLLKLAEGNKSEIEKLLKQHEIDIVNLREKHNFEMESKEKDHKYKNLEMERKFELREKEQAQNRGISILDNVLSPLLGDFIQNPSEAKQKYEYLREFGKHIKK